MLDKSKLLVENIHISEKTLKLLERNLTMFGKSKNAGTYLTMLGKIYKCLENSEHVGEHLKMFGNM